ncbi:hypothetical protein EXE43_18090 [Halorubrum sp. SS5]|nr:hypothetical protein EXE43_18090 [Halorubrum sp. SS5]
MTRDGVRAVALAAIMVVSMVAVGAGFAGSVAGQQSDVHTVGTGDADFDTLSEALDSENVSEGDTIEVRDGTYQELVEVDINGLTITGVGDPLIDVPDSGAGGGEPNIKVTGSDVTIEGLTVDVDNPNGAPTGGIVFEGDNGTAVDNTVVNTGDAVSGQGFIAGGGDSLRVEDNTLNDTIVAYWGNGDAEIRNNEFVGEVTDEALWSTTAGELTVENNDFSAVDTGAAMVKFTDDGVSVNDDTGAEAVATAVGDSNDGVESVTFAGQTYDGNGNVLVSGSDSIQQAIDNAEPGATIAVDGGTYEEQLTIDKEGISLVAGDGTPQVKYGDGVVVQIRAANVSVSGFEIVGGATFDRGNLGMDVRSTPGGASVEVTDTTFEDLYLGIQTGSGGAHSFVVENATVNNSVAGFGHQSETGSAVVQDSHISVNTQGVGLYKANNALVEDNTISVDAASIEGVDPAFGTERGVDVSGSNVTITDNDITSTDSGILSESHGVPVDDVTVTDNVIDADIVAVNDTPDNLDLDAVLADNDFEGATYLSDDGEVGSDAIYGAIGPAADAASDGDTVVAEGGTFTENVTLDTANVTLRGAGSSVVDGRIDITEDAVAVEDLTVRHGAPSGSGEVEGIFVGDANGFGNTDEEVRIHNVTVEDISPHGTGKTLEAIHVKQYGGTVDGVVISETTLRNVTQPAAGANGIKLQAGVSDVTVSGSTIADIEGSWAYGVSATPSYSEDGVPTDVSITSNAITNVSAIDYSGVGVGIDGSDSTFADPTEIELSRNTLTDNGIAVLNKNPDATLDATLNWWGSATGPDTVESTVIGGDVTYDPFLTVEPDEVDADPIDETTQFGHDLVVPADGTPHSVAFPAPVEGNVTEVFGEFNGTVFAYDGDGWESGAEIADEEVGALDAFVVKVDEGESDLRIAFEYTAADAQYPTSADLEEGWNFVGAPESGDSDDAFDVTTTNVATVAHINAGAGSQPYGASSTAPFATNPDSVSPFQGYWVFVTDDGELGATVPVGPTQSNEEGAVTGS